MTNAHHHLHQERSCALDENKERTQTAPAILGDVLYAKCDSPVPEQYWATLVQSIAAGDQLALHGLHERSHRIVFTLIMRITANRETSEELTIDITLCPDCQREVESLRPVGNSVRFLADRCAASDYVAADTPGASHRRGDLQATSAANGAAVG